MHVVYFFIITRTKKFCISCKFGNIEIFWPNANNQDDNSDLDSGVFDVGDSESYPTIDQTSSLANKLTNKQERETITDSECKAYVKVIEKPSVYRVMSKIFQEFIHLIKSYYTMNNGQNTDRFNQKLAGERDQLENCYTHWLTDMMQKNQDRKNNKKKRLGRGQNKYAIATSFPEIANLKDLGKFLAFKNILRSVVRVDQILIESLMPRYQITFLPLFSHANLKTELDSPF